MAKKSATKKADSVKVSMTVPAFVVAIAVQTTLFVLYWRYMKSLTDKHCACALTPRFERIKGLFKVVVGLFYATIACALLCKFVPPELCLAVAVAASVLSIVLSVYVVKWWLEMRAAACECSDAWEKHLWAFLSAYQIASIVIGALSGILAAI